MRNIVLSLTDDFSKAFKVTSIPSSQSKNQTVELSCFGIQFENEIIIPNIPSLPIDGNLCMQKIPTPLRYPCFSIHHINMNWTVLTRQNDQKIKYPYGRGLTSKHTSTALILMGS